MKVAWTGLIWQNIGISGQHLVKEEVEFVFEEPSPFSEGLSCVELVNFIN